MLHPILRSIGSIFHRWGDASLRRSLDAAEIAINDREDLIASLKDDCDVLRQDLARAELAHQLVEALRAEIADLRFAAEVRDTELRKANAENEIHAVERKQFLAVITRDRERVAMEHARFARGAQEAQHAIGDSLAETREP